MTEAIVNSLLFKQPSNHVQYNFPTKIKYLRTRTGNTIAATHIKKRGANVTILYSHGNAEDLNTCYGWLRRLSRGLNVNVFAYDYAGYGGSQGIPSESNVYADVEAAFACLTEDIGLSPHQIVLYGRSLGSGPSCYLAHKSSLEHKPVGGLILHSPFSSVYRVVVNLGFTVAGDKFSNIDRLTAVDCPVFITHGRDDTVVPFLHSEALLEAVPKHLRAAPFWMDQIGHNDHGPQVEFELLDRIRQYLDYHILARRLYLEIPAKTMAGTKQTPTHSINAQPRLRRSC